MTHLNALYIPRRAREGPRETNPRYSNEEVVGNSALPRKEIIPLQLTIPEFCEVSVLSLNCASTANAFPELIVLSPKGT